jgi:hypothetical protein
MGRLHGCTTARMQDDSMDGGGREPTVGALGDVRNNFRGRTTQDEYRTYSGETKRAMSGTNFPDKVEVIRLQDVIGRVESGTETESTNSRRFKRRQDDYMEVIGSVSSLEQRPRKPKPRTPTWT